MNRSRNITKYLNQKRGREGGKEGERWKSMAIDSFFGLSDNKLQIYKVKVQEDFSVLYNNRIALVKQKCEQATNIN